uniref:Transcription and mRNA export factor ENY2 n=1 Tax=Aceria tosichella TaxID=561515 RepID=A0A6G1SPJ6_9ACAR
MKQPIYVHTPFSFITHILIVIILSSIFRIRPPPQTNYRPSSSFISNESPSHIIENIMNPDGQANQLEAGGDNNSPSVSPALNDKREELTELLRSRLIECGWRDQVASMCRDLIQKRGVDQVKLSDIISEVRPEARQKIPTNIRTELLDKIRQVNQESGP